MRVLVVGVLALVLITLFPTPTKAGPVFITNPGFEAGDFTGWTLSGNTGFMTVSTSCTHSGTYGACFGPVGSLGYISQALTTTPGQTYTLSFWHQETSGTPNEFAVFWNGTAIFDQANIPTFAYRLETYSSLLATGDSTVLMFGFRNDPGSQQLDDIAVETSGSEVPEPASIALCGAGLLLLTVARRRRSRQR